MNYNTTKNPIINPSVGGGSIAIGLCVCVSVSLLVRNLGECFVSLLGEPIAGKNVSPSDKKLWRFLKNVSVAEKS